MNLDEKCNLVKRNTVEIVTEEELRQQLSSKKQPVTYCGYETSGELHIGHAVTATKLMDLEKAGAKVVVLLADWHAWLNKKGTWKELHESAEIMKKGFKALGLKNAKYVLGGDFQQTKEYQNDVLTMALHTSMDRALRSMQEIARDYEHAKVSQVIYPLMQVADIKHLKVTIAHGGIEQRKIHMLGREIIETINWPKFCCVHTPLINSLQGPGTKMSSSVPNSFISVRDSEDTVRKKLKEAYCKEGEVEGNPVLEIARLLIFPRVKEFAIKRPAKFGGDVSFKSADELEQTFAQKKLHPLDLKNAVAEELCEILAPARKVFS